MNNSSEVSKSKDPKDKATKPDKAESGLSTSAKAEAKIPIVAKKPEVLGMKAFIEKTTDTEKAPKSSTDQKSGAGVEFKVRTPQKNVSAESDKTQEKSEKLEPEVADEIVAKILGIADENQDDENFDLGSAQFWYKAVRKFEIEALLREKTRLKVLLGGLSKRGYKEDDIHELFRRLKKQAEEERRIEEVYQTKMSLIKRGVFFFCVGIFLVFMFFIQFSQKSKLAEKNRQAKIAAAKTLPCDWNRSLVERVNSSTLGWEPMSSLNPKVAELDLIRCSTGTHKLFLPKGAVLDFPLGAQYKVDKMDLEADEQTISGISITVMDSGLFWVKPERANFKLNLRFPSGQINIKYGNGKMIRTGEKTRIAVQEGETMLTPDYQISVPVNGLMEALFTKPGVKPVVQIYDNY
ncbi:MAG: hypothetical protein HQM10_14910 [Candidatus Riflebacteria bacterium]|nr:hypothetical protein [Candidatus Riflebacteria bacterium]